VLPLLASEGRAPYFYVNQPSGLPSLTVAVKRPAGARASAPRAVKPASAPRAPKATPVEERDYGVCDVCFMVRNAAGKCGCDE
jgi:hypothetical protein